MVFFPSGLRIALSAAAGKDARSAARLRRPPERTGCAQRKLIEGETASAEVRREGLAFGRGMF
jgi:hypothetical protein